MRTFLILALIGTASAARFRQQPSDGDVSEKLAALGPVLDKLRGLDPKTFGVLNGMMNQVNPNSKPTSFIQYLKDDPDATQEKLQALGPILEKLRGLDPKSFGALSNLVGNVQPGAAKGPALLQMKNDPSPEEVSEKLQALGPILDKLKGLDPKAFSAMSGMMDAAKQQAQQK